METSKVSSKWQVVIPRAVRKAERIRVGSEVTFERTADGILLRPVGAGNRISAAQGYGVLKSRRKPADDVDIRNAVRVAAAAREAKRRTDR
jgi:AbrB family looped-hinge helix DNA binding protein